MKKVLIVGGVAGGASCAARLRRVDETAEIIMFEKDGFISFANCGLPYYIGDTIKSKNELTLQSPQSFNKRFNVDVRIFSEVVKINRENKTVTVLNRQTNETYEESYDELVLSMGANPILPNINGIDSDKVFTLRNLDDTFKIKDHVITTKPASALIVGGGFIGIEMAENLHELGVDVTLVQRGNQILSHIDFEMAKEVQNYIKKVGINLLFNEEVQNIDDLEDYVNVKLKEKEFATDMIIFAIGVEPSSKLAKEADLKTNEKGAIVVDEYLLTNDKNIYAIGDAIEVTDFVSNQKTHIPLAGPANKQGRMVADTISGNKTKYKGTQGSSILKILDLTVANTGINEKTAKRLNLNYDKVYTFSKSHAGYYPGSSNMSVKTIFDLDTGKILGAQIVGQDGVDKRIDVLATAIRFGATYKDLMELELAYAPPYSSAKDPVNMAGYVIDNVINGRNPQIHYDEIAPLFEDSSKILLDVRNEMEVSNGAIKNFINIPLDSLRNRLNELDKNKEIIVTCQVGLRGYLATRILQQNGFKVRNLGGGFRLYSVIYK